PPGPVASIANSLTVGMVDIRGVTPPTPGDMDCLTGLTSGTLAVVTASGDSSCVEWSLRTLGSGEIAYVTIGQMGSYWSTTTSGSAGAFNAVARNFAAAADSSSGDPGAPTIEFDVPFTADEGSAVPLSVRITDLEGDPYTFSWDLNNDGIFGENPGNG